MLHFPATNMIYSYFPALVTLSCYYLHMFPFLETIYREIPLGAATHGSLRICEKSKGKPSKPILHYQATPVRMIISTTSDRAI